MAERRGGAPPAKAELKLVLLLGAFVALGPLTIDMYLPALPDIESDLGTTTAAVQLTLTGTLIGLAAGQLVVGPLSDVFGRRRPLVAGTALHVVASLLCLAAPSIVALGALRVFQGVGAASASVVTLAIVRDLFEGRAAAALLSRLMLVLGVAPILAPAMGAALLSRTDWRGVFVVLALAGGVLTILSLVAVPETLPPGRRRSGRVGRMASAYAALLRDRSFVGLILVAGFSMVSLFAYVSGSSFVLQEQYGLSEQEFGVVFGLGAAGLIGGTQLSARLLRWATPERILSWALIGGAASSLLMVAAAGADVGGLAGILVPLWAVLAMTGLSMPNAAALALSRHGEAAGAAAALLGAFRFGMGAVSAPVVGMLGSDSRAMAAVIACGMVLAGLVLVAVVRPGRLGPTWRARARRERS